MPEKRTFLLLSAFFALSLTLPLSPLLCDGNVTITGFVKEVRTGKPVPNANVLVLMGPWGKYSRKVFEGKTDLNGSRPDDCLPLDEDSRLHIGHLGDYRRHNHEQADSAVTGARQAPIFRAAEQLD